MKMYNKNHKIWSLVWPYLIFMIMSAVILWSQYKSRAFILSNDSLFHMHQFYESAMQIKTGHFSWFLTLFGFGQSGRIVNAVYGPIFSYLVGGLLLVVGTWARTQLVLEFLLLVLSSSFMYYLSRSLKFSKALSISLSCIYATSYPILTFLNWQTFDGIGNTLLPLIVLLGVKMLKSGKVRIVPLAVLIAITFQIHVLTTVVATLTLIPFALVGYLYSSRKLQFIIRLGMSVLLFLMLTCNIWATMFDVFYKNSIIKPFPNLNMHQHSFQWINGSFEPLTKVFVIIIFLAIILLVLTWRKANLEQKVIPIIAILFTFLSSTYFPWNQLLKKIPEISQLIQFPERFLGTAVIMILLTVGEGIELLHSSSSGVSHAVVWISLTTLIISALASVMLEINTVKNQAFHWNNRTMLINNTNAPHTNVNVKRIYDSLDNSHQISLAPKYLIKAIPDYLPSNQTITPQSYYRIHPYFITMNELLGYNLSRSQINYTGKYNLILHKRSSRPFYFKKRVNNHGLTIKWHQPGVLNHHKMVLPMVKYHHTQVMMDHHRINPSINQIGLIKLAPQAGYHQIVIRYQAFPEFRLALLANVISWLCILGIGIIKTKEKIRMKNNE